MFVAVAILFFSLLFLVLSQSKDVLLEIWRDIEEYENMKKTGYKKTSQTKGSGGSGLFIDLFFFGLILGSFALLGYFLGCNF